MAACSFCVSYMLSSRIGYGLVCDQRGGAGISSAAPEPIAVSYVGRG
jgi:hypothetical protein